MHPGFPEADTKRWIVPAGTTCKDGDFTGGENTERAVTVCPHADQRHARYVLSLVSILLNAGIQIMESRLTSCMNKACEVSRPLSFMSARYL